MEQKSDKSQAKAPFHHADYYFNLVSYQSTPITRNVTVPAVSGKQTIVISVCDIIHLMIQGRNKL